MVAEASISQAIIRFLRSQGCVAWKHHGSIFGQTGDQDIHVLVPMKGLKYPIPLFIETKRPGKKPRPLQKMRARERQKVGAVVWSVTSVEEVKRLFEELQAEGTGFSASTLREIRVSPRCQICGCIFHGKDRYERSPNYFQCPNCHHEGPAAWPQPL